MRSHMGLSVTEEHPDIAKGLEDTLERWIAEMVEKNGLSEDPLVANDLMLGAYWVEWVKEHGYW